LTEKRRAWGERYIPQREEALVRRVRRAEISDMGPQKSMKLSLEVKE
jgi:hypothetical protein